MSWGPKVAINAASLAATGGPGGNRSVHSLEEGYNLYAYPSLLDPSSERLNYDTIGASGFVYLMGRRTPLPQATNPRGFYIMQDVVRVQLAFE